MSCAPANRLPHDSEGHARTAGPDPAAVIAFPRLRGLFGVRFGAHLDGSFGGIKTRSGRTA